MLKRILIQNLIWLSIMLLLILLCANLAKPQQKEKILNYTEFIEAVDAGQIKAVTIINKTDGSGDLEITEKSKQKFKVCLPDEPSIYLPYLTAKNVKVTFKNSSGGSWIISLIWLLPLVIFAIFWLQIMKNNGSTRAFDFGRSKAKMFLGKNENLTTFKDVGGIPEVKKELTEIIEFLKNPKKFARLGARIPKGTLLVGPPGCGKTLLARAVAGEAGVPFFSVSGSEFVEMFVGVGAARIRDLFAQAKKFAPCIIFIDELDAVGGARGLSLNSNSEREQTLNQLLVEMDGFEANLGIIILAATNRPDMLDKGLLRPGRFNRQIHVPLPDVEGRTSILKIHTRNMPLANEVNLLEIAQMMPGASGADLENVANEAAILAARKGKEKVEKIDFVEAIDKVLMGLERKIIISVEEKNRIAVHEAGHAIVTYTLLGREKLEKISIIPRGMALGVTKQRQEEDHYLYTKKELKAELAILLAGRAAEEIVLKDISSGAANDLERATYIAEKMIYELGMADGLLGVYTKHRETFLGQYAEKESYSEKTAQKMDQAKEKLLADAYNQAKEILLKQLDKLDKVVKGLLNKETIDRDEFEKLIA